MPGISSKVLDMSTAALTEARSHVAAMIDQFGASQPLKAIMPIIARRLGLSERRVWAFWHREARAIRADEMDALRAAVRRAKSTHTLGVISHAESMERAAEALEMVDPDFYGVEIHRLRDAAGKIRGAASYRGGA